MSFTSTAAMARRSIHSDPHAAAVGSKRKKATSLSRTSRFDQVSARILLLQEQNDEGKKTGGLLSMLAAPALNWIGLHGAPRLRSLHAFWSISSNPRPEFASAVQSVIPPTPDGRHTTPPNSHTHWLSAHIAPRSGPPLLFALLCFWFLFIGRFLVLTRAARCIWPPLANHQFSCCFGWPLAPTRPPKPRAKASLCIFVPPAASHPDGGPHNIIPTNPQTHHTHRTMRVLSLLATVGTAAAFVRPTLPSARAGRSAMR